MLTADHKQFYDENGYVVVSGLFSPDEVARYRDHFMTLRQHGTYSGDFAGVNAGSNDPLKLYPRMIHMHRWDEVSRRWLLDQRLNACLTGLLGREPYAVQTMLYFKPPGARGQALHQDNFYLKVEPGTCIAAWIALDPADRENGGLEVVPGTHAMDLFCPEEADLDISFTRDYVPVPPGLAAEPVDLAPGDVLFFNGSLVHGSQPNRTADRFRRSFICHYIGQSSEEVARHYKPLYRFDGSEVQIAEATGGGPCGDAQVKEPH